MDRFTLFWNMILNEACEANGVILIILRVLPLFCENFILRRGVNAVGINLPNGQEI